MTLDREVRRLFLESAMRDEEWSGEMCTSATATLQCRLARRVGRLVVQRRKELQRMDDWGYK